MEGIAICGGLPHLVTSDVQLYACGQRGAPAHPHLIDPLHAAVHSRPELSCVAFWTVSPCEFRRSRGLLLPDNDNSGI